MIKAKIFTLIIVSILFLSGCAIKKTDSTTTKILKHTVNSPFYVLVGTAVILNVLNYRPYYSHGHRIRYYNGYHSRGHGHYR